MAKKKSKKKDNKKKDIKKKLKKKVSKKKDLKKKYSKKKSTKKKDPKKKDPKKKEDKKISEGKPDEQIPISVTVDQPKAKSPIVSDHSSNYNVSNAVKKLRSLKSVDKVLLFTKGDKRLTVTNAILATKNRLKK